MGYEYQEELGYIWQNLRDIAKSTNNISTISKNLEKINDSIRQHTITVRTKEIKEDISDITSLYADIFKDKKDLELKLKYDPIDCIRTMISIVHEQEYSKSKDLIKALEYFEKELLRYE